MVFGAVSTVLWQYRQAASLICRGRAMYRARPVGVSRSPMISGRSCACRNWFTTSVSQSVARLRGLVGLSVASL